MEGLETIGAAAGLALLIAFFKSKAWKEFCQNWELRKLSQGTGPADNSPWQAHPLTRDDGRRSPLDKSGRD